MKNLAIYTLFFVCFLFCTSLVVADDYPIGEEPKYNPYHEEYLQNAGIEVSPSSLKTSLLDENARIRMYSAIVIMQKELNTLEASVEKAFLKEQEVNVKIEMAKTLIFFKNNSANSYLKSFLTDAVVSSDSLVAAGLLSKVGDNSGYPLVKKALFSQHQTTRIKALYQLSNFEPFEGQSVGEVVITVYQDLQSVLAKDDAAFVRSEAARELSNLDPIKAFAILENFSNDESEKVQRSVSVAMQKVKTIRAKGIL